MAGPEWESQRPLRESQRLRNRGPSGVCCALAFPAHSLSLDSVVLVSCMQMRLVCVSLCSILIIFPAKIYHLHLCQKRTCHQGQTPVSKAK